MVWAADDVVGAAVDAVVDDELVLLEEVLALVVDVVDAAVVDVEVELEEDELAPDVVLVLDPPGLAVVVAIEVVVSGTEDDETAAVVSVVTASASVGSVTAADLGDNAWALAFESSSDSMPPMPAGLSPRRWPFMSAPTPSLPIACASPVWPAA